MVSDKTPVCSRDVIAMMTKTILYLVSQPELSIKTETTLTDVNELNFSISLDTIPSMILWRHNETKCIYGGKLASFWGSIFRKANTEWNSGLLVIWVNNFNTIWNCNIAQYIRNRTKIYFKLQRNVSP